MAEVRIWRDIRLTREPKESSESSTDDEEGSSDTESSVEEDERVVTEYEEELKEIFLPIIVKGNEGKWSSTTSLKMSSAVGSLEGAGKMLEMMMPRLRVLKVDGEEVMSAPIPIRLHPNLDDKFISLNLSFPALTTLFIGNGTIQQFQAVPWILHRCPNIISFSLEYSQKYDLSHTKQEIPRSLGSPTKIRSLTLSLRVNPLHPYGGEARRKENLEPISIFISIIRICPNMEELTARCRNFDKESERGIIKIVETYKGLWNFDWIGRDKGLIICRARAGRDISSPLFCSSERFDDEGRVEYDRKFN